MAGASAPVIRYVIRRWLARVVVRWYALAKFIHETIIEAM
jgi:hypothetical protein